MKICWILNTFRVMYDTKGWLFITYLIHIICWVSDNKLYYMSVAQFLWIQMQEYNKYNCTTLRTYAMHGKCELFVTLALGIYFWQKGYTFLHEVLSNAGSNNYLINRLILFSYFFSDGLLIGWSTCSHHQASEAYRRRPLYVHCWKCARSSYRISLPRGQSSWQSSQLQLLYY